jgi:ketosteroid isomerase-like protein
VTVSDRLQAVREVYGAYESGDRGVVEQHLADDFTFSAPPDVGIDRTTYFQRCWPNSRTTEAFEFQRLFEGTTRSS